MPPEPITDEMVARAARMLQWLGWDLVEYEERKAPTPNLERAARSALVAALSPDTLPPDAPALQGPPDA